MPTIRVSTDDEEWRETEAFSDIKQPLVITQSIEEGEEEEGFYAITHVKSGKRIHSDIGSLSFIEAQCSLERLLPLVDWSLPGEALNKEGLYRQVRRIIEDCRNNISPATRPQTPVPLTPTLKRATQAYRFTLKIRRALYGKHFRRGEWEVVSFEEPVADAPITQFYEHLLNRSSAIEKAREVAHEVTKIHHPQLPTRVLDESGECLLTVHLRAGEPEEGPCPPPFWLRNPLDVRTVEGVGSGLAIVGGVVLGAFSSLGMEYSSDKTLPRIGRVFSYGLIGLGVGLAAALVATHSSATVNPRSRSTFIIQSPFETVVVSDPVTMQAVAYRLSETASISIREVFSDGTGRWIVAPELTQPEPQLDPFAEYVRRIRYWLVISHDLTETRAARVTNDNLPKIEDWYAENCPEWRVARQLAQLFVGQRFTARKRRSVPPRQI